MKNKKLSKQEILNEINKIFSKSLPTSKEIKKAKKLAMSKNIKLGEKRKLFCKKCFTYFTSENSEIRIKKQMKIIKCKMCGYVSRWKMRGNFNAKNMKIYGKLHLTIRNED